MNDYRNRPPVDAPRPHPFRVVMATRLSVLAAAALAWVGVAAAGYAVAVVLGLAFR